MMMLGGMFWCLDLLSVWLINRPWKEFDAIIPDGIKSLVEGENDFWIFKAKLSLITDEILKLRKNLFDYLSENKDYFLNLKALEYSEWILYSHWELNPKMVVLINKYSVEWINAKLKEALEKAFDWDASLLLKLADEFESIVWVKWYLKRNYIWKDCSIELEKMIKKLRKTLPGCNCSVYWHYEWYTHKINELNDFSFIWNDVGIGYYNESWWLTIKKIKWEFFWIIDKIDEDYLLSTNVR
jgi:hypothetical protein